MVVTNVGNDVTLTWEGTAYIFKVYLDGLLVATILTSAWPGTDYSHTFTGAADGEAVDRVRAGAAKRDGHVGGNNDALGFE